MPGHEKTSAANTASDLERIEVVGKSTMLSELYRDLFHPVRKKTGQMQAAEEKEEELDELDELTNEEPVGTIYDSQPIMNQAAAVKTAPAKKRKTPLLMVLGGAAVAIAAIVLVMVLPKILGEKETNPEPAPRLDVETPSKPDEVEVAGSVETKPTEPAVVEKEVKEDIEPAPEPPKKPTGRLFVNAIPWAKVYKGKRFLGDTPLENVRLPVGRHKIRLVNEGLNVDMTVHVNIRKNRATKKVYNLRE